MRFYRLKTKWTRFWLRFSGIGLFGKVAAWLATWFVPPYFARVSLSRQNSRGFVSASATIHHPNLNMGRHCFMGEDVLIYQDLNGGAVTLGDAVHIHRGTIIQTGEHGFVVIGTDTHIQPRCQFSAYKGGIQIGERVEIAPNCAFYPYNHGTALDTSIRQQPIFSRKGITVGDDAWLGYGVILLDGATVGKGAVIGAGSIVTGDIPDGAIAVGAPAKVRRMRE